MSMDDATSHPHWLDRAEYPFDPKYVDLPAGRMHYVDEGTGPPIVMVHGTPTWSFLYRTLIKELSADARVIAPDHIGFGLSDKPPDWSYRPQDHAANLHTLIEALDLKDITLMVHDFGGPIGLSYAIEQPDNVAQLVLFNTWMWSLAENADVRRASRFFGSTLGRWLYKRLNFSPRVLVKMAYGDKKKLTKQIHRHYIRPFPSARDRQGPWVFARELIGSSDWFEALWQKRDRIAQKPALVLWGMRDPLLSSRYLERWRTVLTNAQFEQFEEAGHFVPEEAGARLVPIIRAFMDERRQPQAPEHAG